MHRYEFLKYTEERTFMKIMHKILFVQCLFVLLYLMCSMVLQNSPSLTALTLWWTANPASSYFLSVSQALQSNLRYSLLPKRLIIGKRLAQCLHPALPSGVHLKALETYEVIFKIIGTKWLAKDLFIYRWRKKYPHSFTASRRVLTWFDFLYLSFFF